MEAAKDIMKRNKITVVIMEVSSPFADVKNLNLFMYKENRCQDLSPDTGLFN